MKIENDLIELLVCDDAGNWQIRDKRSGVLWKSRDDSTGEATVETTDGEVTIPLVPDYLTQEGETVRLACRSREYHGFGVDVTISVDGDSVELSYVDVGKTPAKSVKLIADALSITDGDDGYLLVPVRLGLLIRPDSGVEFTRRFGTFDYEGCHMEMMGFVKNGGALLVTWHDPYVVAEVKSKMIEERQNLMVSFIMQKTARKLKLTVLGSGDINQIAQAYRETARRKGWLQTWDQKLKLRPKAEKLFGAINFKLWTTLARRIDENLNEVSVDVRWTFDEVAQIAEHLKNDLKLDKVFFIIGGWIRKGYDCQHPDILPAAPECGGNEKLRECVRRVQKCGFLFGMHDNYQDMYRDAPSWDEDYIMKNPDGSLRKGGLWLGGRAYLTCSKKAIELARRPQNLPEVKRLFDPDVYFIDTTYAAGLYECFDPNHPLTKWDDMYWKQAISYYAQEIFGLFGSECGREWAIPCADWFEGITGVSGGYYHNLDLSAIGASPVPLFVMVYGDSVVMHGKYGYRFGEAAEYVTHHVSIGRTLNYHSIGHHLYWENDTTEELPLPDEGVPDKACFTRAHNGWAEGMCLTDRFIKNTAEILSPLNEIVSRTRLTQIRFLTGDLRVRETRFGATRVVVNNGDLDYAVTSDIGGKVWLPPYGFVVESPTFVAFHAKTWNKVEYDSPVLFTLRSTDGKPITESDNVRIYHGFGDARINWKGKLIQVRREMTIQT